MEPDINAVIERTARVCHEANRAYALATGEPPALVHPTWSEAPEEIRDSAREGVRRALAGATPEQLHVSWMAGKRAAGWVYGPARDNVAKVHPCLVPYTELPIAQQRKDALFSGIVDALK
jgi:hypothetical protein